MTKRERTEAEINERRSRFVWTNADIEIIKSPNVSPQADPNHIDGEVALPNGDKGNRDPAADKEKDQQNPS